MENKVHDTTYIPRPSVLLEAKKEGKDYLDLPNSYNIPYEVGTKIYLDEAKASTPSVLWFGAYYSGITYGYECEDGTESSETKIETKVISSGITEGNHKLTIQIKSTVVGNEAIVVEAAQASSCKISNCSLGCLGVGGNNLLLTQTSPKQIAEFKSYITQKIYPLSNYGNKSKTALEPLEGGVLEYTPYYSNSNSLYGYYRFFVGTTDKIDTNSFSSNDIRELDYSGFVRYDNKNMKRPDAEGDNGIGNMITYGYSNKQPIQIEGTNKSIVIAFPVGYDRYKFNLTKVENVEGFNILNDFKRLENPVIVKCGDGDIEIEYCVYLNLNLTGEPLSVKNIEISDYIA